MIKVADKLWVGNSDDSYKAAESEFDALVNVAFDLAPVVYWPNIEYVQVGLTNGPGNNLSDYCAAVLAVKRLTRTREKVLIYDHEGALALVIAMMYMNVTSGKVRPDVCNWSHWPTWQERLMITFGRIPEITPDIHKCHIEAFNKLSWGLLEVL